MDEQDSKPSTEGDLIAAAHASFFLLPSGGGEERETKQKEQSNKLITSHYSGINGKAMGLSTKFLARAMYKKCLSPSVLEVEPDVSGE